MERIPATKAQQLIERCMKDYPMFLKLGNSDAEKYWIAIRSLVVMDALISGQEADYKAVSASQVREKLTEESFYRLSDFFYTFKVKEEYRRLLEIYILLDNFSQTYLAEELLKQLPEEHRHPETRTDMIISLVKYGMIPEVESLPLHNQSTLQYALRYQKEAREWDNGKPLFDYAEEEKKIVYAAIICNIAALVGTLNATGSLMLSEPMARELLFFVDHRYDSSIATSFAKLTEE